MCTHTVSHHIPPLQHCSRRYCSRQSEGQRANDTTVIVPHWCVKVGGAGPVQIERSNRKIFTRLCIILLLALGPCNAQSMESQENGRVSSGASLGREGVLGAALPTAEHVTLRQSSLMNAATSQPLGRMVSKASTLQSGTVNRIEIHSKDSRAVSHPL